MPNKRRKKQPQPKYQALKLLRNRIENSDHINATFFGVTRSTILRWRNPKTMLNQYDADHYAIKLGKHPSEIWTDWFDQPC